MSGFSSLNLASRALSAQQRALEVTGQNIANVNTPGYTRQRVDMQSLASTSAYGLYAKEDGLGNGVSADKISRIRDAFLDVRAQQEAGKAAQASVVASTYAGIETSFAEPGASGLQTLMATASAAWSSLSSAPTDTTRRNQVLAASQAVAQGLGTADAALGAQWDNALVNTQDVVTEANASLRSIADLNAAIRKASINGQPANELRDQRDQLVRGLAESIGATSVDGDEGMVDVVLGGTTLISGTRASQLTLGGGSASATMGSSPVTLGVVDAGGVTIQPGGTVGGRLAAMNTLIPGFRADLDRVANALATGVNDALTAPGAAFDQNGDPGTPLFSGTTAGTITVAITDPRKLAAATAGKVGGVASADGKLADAIALLAKDPAGAEGTYRSMITDLGVRSRTAAATVASADAVSAQVETARQSVSAVSLDEEMTNMLMFKQSYAAAARVVTAIDEMLDVLINRTGLVGR
ncbi:flagellar hook-associated protein FlgK [Klenkia sp. LSe6-5]|uniref:Flagellar hook-associated protein 1 n=1 Tax=Klenkia sesuvii TaxID=3103137 RepID=A0ABU8DPF8_9ACTN